MYRFKKPSGDILSACVYYDGLTGYCDKLKVSSLHYLETGFRFFVVLILGYEKARTAHYHHYRHLVFTDAGAIYRPCLKNLAFLYLLLSETILLETCDRN